LWAETTKIINLLSDQQKEIYKKDMDAIVRARQKELAEEENTKK
jgi:hypothetical protein